MYKATTYNKWLSYNSYQSTGQVVNFLTEVCFPAIDSTSEELSQKTSAAPIKSS